MVTLLLILFFLFTYSLFLYIDQKDDKMSNDMDQSKTRWSYDRDRILLPLLYGFMAAAYVTSIYMLMSHFWPLENKLLASVASIGIGLLLLVSGHFLIKKIKNR